MEQDCGERILELRADGGPAGNPYLMQFQSDIAEVTVGAADRKERYGRWKEAVGLVL